MPGKKTQKQRKKELIRNRLKLKEITKADLIRIGKSLDRGQKW